MRLLFQILLLLVIASSCEKEDVIPIVREDLIGVWANQSNGDDYLEFREWYTLIDRTTYPGVWDSTYIYYNYELWNDTLELRISTGTDEKYNLYKCKLQFLDSDNKILNIEGLENVPPFHKGEDFVKFE